MNICAAVGKRIKQFLKERNMTTYRLEMETGILHTTMSNVINGKNQSVNLKTLMQICQGLKISLSEFFSDPIFDFDNFNLE